MSGDGQQTAAEPEQGPMPAVGGLFPEALPRGDFAAGVLELEAVLDLLEPYVHSSLGRRALRELGPLPEPEAREGLLRLVELERLEREGALPSLAGLTDPLALLAAAGRGPIGEEELGTLLGLLAALERLRDEFAARGADLPGLTRLVAGLPDLGDLAQGLAAVLDERGRLRDEASPLLARLRRETRELEQRITATLERLAQSSELRHALADTRVHLRGGRRCLAFKAKSSGRVAGVLHDRSQSEQTIYVEPQAVVALSNRLSEARLEEQRELARVLAELTRRVLARRGELQAAARGLARLELGLIGRRFAQDFHARVPNLLGERGAAPGLRLRQARHPLLVAESRAGRLAEVVPIDLHLGLDFDMLILTGPNTGGKTLALKTAGLCALLVRCGLPVPCEPGSTVPFYQGVCADIGDEQEISQSLSTFSSHLVRIRAGLERAGPGTLVLLDELGGGTDPEEGAALGEAILEEFLRRGAHTLVSTHLGRLKEFAFRNVRVENGCTEFDLATLAPRYRVIVGVPGESAALVIARRLGLSQGLVARAEERLERREQEVQELLAEVRQARVQTERVREQAEERLREAEGSAQRAEAQTRELALRGERLEAEAQRDLEERVREARAALERARRLVQQVPAGPRSELEAALAELAGAIEGATLTQRREAFLAGLRKGLLVYLPRYRQRVQVHRIDPARRQLVVKLGSLKLTVSFEEVTPYESL